MLRHSGGYATYGWYEAPLQGGVDTASLSQTKRALLGSLCIAAPCLGVLMLVVTHYLLFFSRQGRRYLGAKLAARKSAARGYQLMEE